MRARIFRGRSFARLRNDRLDIYILAIIDRLCEDTRRFLRATRSILRERLFDCTLQATRIERGSGHAALLGGFLGNESNHASAYIIDSFRLLIRQGVRVGSSGHLFTNRVMDIGGLLRGSVLFYWCFSGAKRV